MRRAASSAFSLARRFARAAADLVLPPRCACCDAFVDRGAPFCPACTISLIADDGSPRATDPDRSPVASARAALRYGGAVARAIQRLKFEDAAWIARPLASYVAPHVARLRASVDLVVPVPLHAAGLRARGYNQAALIARYAADRRLPVDCAALCRVRRTRAQRQLSRTDRWANVQGAFAAQPARVAQCRVLLVDDVLTTGATAVACAQALRCAGAAEIHVLTLARAVP